MTQTPESQMDQIDFIMQVETDGFNHEDNRQVAALQSMIDSGLAFRLQGFWGRFATQMINLGIVNPPRPSV